MRLESDYLGDKQIPDDAYYGIATARAAEIYNVSGYRWQRVFIRSLAQVKKAAFITIRQLGHMDATRADALIQAAEELEEGRWDGQIIVDPLQGGAGTATNFNINEVLANRALEIKGCKKGRYDLIHPLNDANCYQSTNDVIPTAARIAVIYSLKALESSIEAMQSALQEKEQAFAGMVKSGRTQYQAAVPVSLGMEFGAWAEAIARDRWRVFKSYERIKTLNLGGTAVGTGITAPRKYIFMVTGELRRITGLTIARAENMVDATSNQDVFAELSGIMRSHAANLIKIGNDLRFLSSDVCGEIMLKPLFRGSSIMPGKVNPVIPEMMVQAGMKVLGNDSIIVNTVAAGHLELNAFLPLMTYSLLESLELLQRVDEKAVKYCIRDIEADLIRLKENLYRSNALITALLPEIGYERAEELWKHMQVNQTDLVQANRNLGMLEEDRLLELLNPYNLLKMGEAD